MLEELFSYFQFSYVKYAFIVGILIAICAALIGASLVLKRFSYIGDGLSHLAFGVLAVATVLKMTNTMYLILPATVLCAIILLKTGQNTKIKGDAAIAMISVAALAIGYILLNVFAPGSNISGDVCTSLFGSTSILTLHKSDVILCVVLTVIICIVYIIYYNRIFAVTFDESFSKATGINTNFYNLLIAVITGVIIVTAMNFVGSLLISALIIFPAMSAMRLVSNYKGVIILSVILSVISASVGIIISILAATPVGSTIVCVNMFNFGICYIINFFRRVL